MWVAMVISMPRASAVWKALNPADQTLLTQLAAQAKATGASRIALVGGGVRDALLGGISSDLDVVVEGGNVEALAHASGLPHVYHPAFQNATLSLPDRRSVDVVGARKESYPVPGQNPQSEPGTLEDDLWRRDFSINALALLVPEGPLLDVTGGLDDLSARRLRPLHSRSFRDDPSRLVRGARLAARLDLEAAPELLMQIPDALALAGQTPRLWAEMKLLLQERRPGKAARQLVAWGAGELLPDIDILEALDAMQEAGTSVNYQTYAAALLAASEEPQILSQKLGLGEKPAALLARAQFDDFFAPNTPERQLRGLLRPESYVPLTGKDVLALGVAPGKAVGEALAYLAALRRLGKFSRPEEERVALRDYVTEQDF